ncbi:MAG TPA: hypothetical protein VHS58_11400 [Acetobacteraceae bacterium]|jgi:hypothetical protein|nr:hypothetical protein [Acetobacteraceae bacterium]
MNKTRGLIGAALLGAALFAPHAANAWWRGGLVVGIPFPYPYFGPPAVVYPPPVYAPPPIVYDPNQSVAAARAISCDAGPYVCPLDGSVAPGSPCSCPTNRGGHATGTAR